MDLTIMCGCYSHSTGRLVFQVFPAVLISIFSSFTFVMPYCSLEFGTHMVLTEISVHADQEFSSFALC